MNSAAIANAPTMASFVHPVITSTAMVMETTLGFKPEFDEITTRDSHTPSFPISSIFELTGDATGIMGVSLSRNAAIEAMQRMLGIETTEIDELVQDAVGELGNMIVGMAKSKFTGFDIEIGVPRIGRPSKRLIAMPCCVVSISTSSACRPHANNCRPTCRTNRPRPGEMLLIRC